MALSINKTKKHMNFIKSNISKAVFGALSLLACGAFTACTDTNDWDVDPSYDRLFHSSKLEVKVGEDNAEVTFKKMPDVEYYVIEYSTDSLYDDVATTEHSVVLGEDKSITSSPYTITNLEGATKYFLRIKSCSTTGKGSTWKYLDGTDYNYSFTTKSEQIITSVLPGSTKVTVNFVPGKTITEAQIVKDNDTIVSKQVSAEEIAAGTLVVSGLKAKTTYTVRLINDETVRGSMNFTTTEAYPDGYEVITLADGDDIRTVLQSATNDKVVVVFPQGMTYQTLAEDGSLSSLKVPENIKSVYFWGASGATKPKWKFKGVSLEATNVDVVRFYNLEMYCSSNSDGYVLNQSGSFTANSVQMEKCDVKDIRGIFRFQSITDGKVGDITINDCQITNIGSYGILNTKDQKNLELSTVKIANSTFNTVNSVLTNTSQNNFTIDMDHCTIWNCVPATKPFFDVQKQENVIVNCTNSLIGAYYNADGTQTVKGHSLKNMGDVTGTSYTSDFSWNSGYEIGSQISETSAQLWEKPSTTDANFTVKNSTYKNFGDPRWIPAE